MSNTILIDQEEISDVQKARERLLKANEKIMVGEASTELLDELNEAYEQYIEARMSVSKSEAPEDALLKKVLTFIKTHLR